MTIDPISARAVIKALGKDQEDAAAAHDENASQAALDEADLRDVERAEYYGDAPAKPPAKPAVTHRSLIDRLLGR
jgi:hypothetical protein